VSTSNVVADPEPGRPLSDSHRGVESSTRSSALLSHRIKVG